MSFKINILIGLLVFFRCFISLDYLLFTVDDGPDYVTIGYAAGAAVGVIIIGTLFICVIRCLCFKL